MSSCVNEFGQQIGIPVPNWKGSRQPGRKVLQGKYCRVEPISAEKHGSDLFSAYSAADNWKDWTYLFSGPFDTEDEYCKYLRDLESISDPLHFAIIDKNIGKAVGTAALMRIDTANGVVEIGSICFSPSLQRTRAGTEFFLLVLKYVFEELGYRRFEWKCDSLNIRSRASAVRFGFTFEGIFRQAVVMHGRNRDTAWYSIIDRDFKKISTGLSLWLNEANFDANGYQRKPLRFFLEKLNSHL